MDTARRGEQTMAMTALKKVGGSLSMTTNQAESALSPEINMPP